jgi:hypothetical protein
MSNDHDREGEGRNGYKPTAPHLLDDHDDFFGVQHITVSPVVPIARSSRVMNDDDGQHHLNEKYRSGSQFIAEQYMGKRFRDYENDHDDHETSDTSTTNYIDQQYFQLRDDDRHRRSRSSNLRTDNLEHMNRVEQSTEFRPTVPSMKIRSTSNRNIAQSLHHNDFSDSNKEKDADNAADMLRQLRIKRRTVDGIR